MSRFTIYTVSILLSLFSTVSNAAIPFGIVRNELGQLLLFQQAGAFRECATHGHVMANSKQLLEIIKSPEFAREVSKEQIDANHFWVSDAKNSVFLDSKTNTLIVSSRMVGMDKDWWFMKDTGLVVCVQASKNAL